MMKGNISIGQFIKQVKKELMDARAGENEEAFYQLRDVQLEVSFALASETQGKAKLLVVDAGTSIHAAQTHKVILSLSPLNPKGERGKANYLKGAGGKIKLPDVEANYLSAGNDSPMIEI